MTLHLERLEISGFKSFVDPVTLRFAGGITAIVGPNGCGKSNLADAMTWVLGEQSAKSLRGGTMEDVIFAGSERRKPLGMADVTLHLKTDPAFPHSEDGHLSIGRRVFRSGESRYSMNGQTVRLKDIKDVLMDTGLGIRAYSVIEQGKVGMILSGKPQERRKLLEEAAGITRYKQRKRIAEVKLEEATANMMRLDDVISEVERALRSLKRQASAARRFKKKQEAYRDLLRRVLAGRWAEARSKLGRVEAELATTQSREAELAARLARDEATLAAARERLEELAETLSARHQRHADLAATIEGRQQFLKASRERLEELGDRARQSRKMADRRQTEIARQREALERRAADRATLETELEAAAREVDRDAAEISSADERFRAAEQRLEETRQRLLAATGELNALRNRRHQGQIELEKRQYRLQHLGEELEERGDELEQAGSAVEEARARVSDLEQRSTARDEELQAVRGDLETTLEREAEAGRRQRDLENRLAEAQRQRKLLVELNRAFAERRERIREALSEVDVETTFLADRLRAVEGWERALDFYLAGLEHAVLLPAAGAEAADGAGALAVAGALEGGPGVTLVEPLAAAPGDDSPAAPLTDDPAVVLSLGEALGLSPALAAALPPAFLVERPQDAARLARRHPGVSFLSRRGVWATGGTLHVEAGEAAPGVLERERELAELEHEIPRVEEELHQVGGLLDRLVARRSSLAKEANALEGTLAKLRQELAVARARREDAVSRRQRLDAERETVASERAELQRELARVSGDHRQLVDEITEAERRSSTLESEQDAAVEELEAARATRQDLKEASADRRGRLELLRERLDAHDREMERLRSEVGDGERQVAEWHGEEQRLTARREELTGEIATAEQELQAALEQREESGAAVVAAQETLNEQRETIRSLERGLLDVRSSRDEVRAEVEELRVRQAGLKQDADHAAGTFRDEFVRPQASTPTVAEEDEAEAADEEPASEAADGPGAESRTADGEAAPDDLPEDADDGPTEGGAADDEPPAVSLDQVAALLADEVGPELAPPPNLAELETELARTKAALERLGPVNVLAVEEYAEQEERHEFLTAQRADVADSVVSLKRTIREINQTSSERFRETFAEVNQAFDQVFQRLFRGGEAEMRLLDEDDVLESGIEIVARPPGKRLQNIMLMSGGEKALTALALLFALFHVKPSPFCILDEVDAPLDDLNTMRFRELLEEMAVDTQLLVITHNKITMEAASTLYGVTMQEKGVSRLVSVELDEVQPEREIA